MTQNSELIALAAALLMLAGCADNRPPQERREGMTRECIANGQNPVDCAEAARQVIP